MSNEQENVTTRKGRPRTGTLIWRKSGWRARITVTLEGESIQQVHDLGTTVKAIARRRLAKLLKQTAAGETPPADGPRGETVGDYADAWIEGRVAKGVRIAADERRWFDRFWREAIGHLLVGDVRAAHIRAVLEDCATGKLRSHRGEMLARASIVQVHGIANRIFDAAWQEELIDANPAARVKVRTIAPADVKKHRAIPTDDEFRLMLAHPRVDLEIKMLALIGRTVGGQRAGDLNFLAWPALTADFAECMVPRRKTGKPQPLEVPEVVRPFLRAWWEFHGRPTEGPVFPARRGKRAGQHKSESSSGYAKRIRRAFKLALGVAWYDGSDNNRFCEKDAASYTARERELFTKSEHTLPIDFHHGTRGAYSTALARTNTNAQQAQVLAGHSDAATHMRYVASTTIRALPEAAVPLRDASLAAGLSAQAMQKLRRGRRERPLIPVDLSGIEPLTSALRREGSDCNAPNPPATPVETAAVIRVHGDDAEPPCIKSVQEKTGAVVPLDAAGRRVIGLASDLATAAQRGDADAVRAFARLIVAVDGSSAPGLRLVR